MSIWIITVICVLAGILLLLATVYIDNTAELALRQKELARLLEENEILREKLAKRMWGEFDE